MRGCRPAWGGIRAMGDVNEKGLIRVVKGMMFRVSLAIARVIECPRHNRPVFPLNYPKNKVFGIADFDIPHNGYSLVDINSI